MASLRFHSSCYRCIFFFFVVLSLSLSWTQGASLPRRVNPTISAVPSSVLRYDPSYGSGQSPQQHPDKVVSNDIPSPAVTSCPVHCVCDTTSQGKRRVSCTEGAMDSIPTHMMDKSTEIILFTAPEERDNEVSLGRIFMELPNLEDVTISHSNLPAIGDSSFWPGRNLINLDLSHNNIRYIRDSDFNGLSALSSLNLSHNIMTEPPSAPFRFLANLTKLSLAHNKITKLVPRLFFKLDKLEMLDLSDNPLNETTLSAETFKDVKTLKTLRIERSSIRSISPLTYKQLPNLKELHLSDNRLSFITSFEFSPLSNSLKHLYLDGNSLSTLRDNSFYGLRLQHLGLSRNSLTSLPPCVFCNLQVESLDLSSNRFTTFSPLLLSPVSHSLIALHIGGNTHLDSPAASISSLISPLSNLQIVKFPSCNMTSVPLLPPLPYLSSLDASDNKMTTLTADAIKVLSAPSLKSVYLHNNPWDCDSCSLLPLLQAILPAYNNMCPSKSSNTNMRCMVCATGPDGVRGKPLHLVALEEVADGECVPPLDPSIVSSSSTGIKSDNRRSRNPKHLLATSDPGIGLIICVLLVSCIIVAAITSTLIFKCRYEAVYYTREENRNKSSPSRSACSMHHFNPRYPPHVTTHLTSNGSKGTGWFTLNSSVKTSSLNSSSGVGGGGGVSCTGCCVGGHSSAASFSRKFHSLRKSPFKVSLPSRKMSTSSCHSTSPISMSGSDHGFPLTLDSPPLVRTNFRF